MIISQLINLWCVYDLRVLVAVLSTTLIAFNKMAISASKNYNIDDMAVDENPKSQPPAVQYADPTAMGLLSFAISAVVLGLYHCGVGYAFSLHDIDITSS